VGIAPHIARLRAFVGHELLLLPSVAVLPFDESGRLLLVKPTGHNDGWHTLGGAVDMGESPAEAAVREAREEIGVGVRLVRLIDVLGGPDYEVHYPNGDRAAYVSTVYEARIVEGAPAPSDGELSEVAWFEPSELAAAGLSRFADALLSATGYLKRLCATAPQLSLHRRGHCVASNPLADGGTAWRSAAARRNNTSLRIPKQAMTTRTGRQAA
jgi:ADP-ribose pyrophosphatase YjhB (NUDIX family)